MTKAEKLEFQWRTRKRWQGIVRPYSAEDVLRLRTSIHIEYTFGRFSAKRFWGELHSEFYIPALGAMTGQQAVQMAKAGLKAIYCSGWQVAADANSNLQTFPDQSSYDPLKGVPCVVERINNAFMRADQIQKVEGSSSDRWYLPIVADGESGGGKRNTFNLMCEMIKAGAAAVHFEDQLGQEKKCGHLGGKVLVPVKQHIETLVAARFATDVMDVPTIIIARTDAESADLLTNDIDDLDKPFLTGERTPEGHYRVRCGLDLAIMRAIAYAPYADLLWMETKTPDLEEARKFAEGVHKKFPGKMLAYNCSPSFNWLLNFAKKVFQGLNNDAVQKMLGPISNEVLVDKNKSSEEKLLLNPNFRALVDKEIGQFQSELGKMGYKFQFVTLAGWHVLSYSMFELAKGYVQKGMSAYVLLQQEEFAAEKDGYEATRHQREVGTGFFDAISEIVSGGTSSTKAMKGSTESEQFGK